AIRERAEGARRHSNLELGIAHRADRVAEALVVERARENEEDLADEDVATRELVDERVQKRVVLRLQRVAPRRERRHDVAVLEEQRALVGVDGEVAPKRERLVRMLEDDLVLLRVRTRNHHALDA